MDNSVAKSTAAPSMPGDRFANWGLGMAFLSMTAVWLTIMLTNFDPHTIELGFFWVGMLVWFLAWIANLVLSIAALRNAHSNLQAKLLRRKAIGGLVISAVSVLTGLLFFAALITESRF